MADDVEARSKTETQRRERAEAALQISEARWQAVIESAVDAIVVIDSRGRIETFNPAAVRMFGYAEAEVLGENVSMLMPEPYRSEHDGYINRYLRTGEHRIIGVGREVTGMRRDGSTFPVRLAVGEMQVGNERRFTGILHDLSQRVALEARLREQAALARLGEMAAVIAHEVKNPLAAVSGAIQVIGRRLPPDSKEAPIVKEIVTRLEGLNGLLKDLLLFARTPQPKPAPLDILSLLRLTADLLSSDPSFGAMSVEIAGRATTIQADADLIKIVFQNLFINAAHAMQGRGEIQVEVDEPDGSLQVTVRDQGPGIPDDVRQRLFQPFFTTKSRGTGLGLSTARRLIEAHGGTIAIDCPPEGGTVVTIRLPLENGAEGTTA
jgi:two-component system sensor kinase FixL